MPFSFGNPWFLLGLGAIAVPIYLHLFHRRTPVSMDFPSLRLLRRSLETIQHRVRLRNLILLALRLLVLALLVIGLARPYWRPGALFGARHAHAAVSLVILLDNSMSMGASDQGISLFSAAKSRALEVLDRLGPEDKAAVVLAAEPAQVAFNQLTWDKEDLKTFVRDAPLTSAGTDLAGALKLALGLLKQSRSGVRQILTITDATEVAWQPLLEKYDIAAIDRQVELLMIPIGRQAPANLTVSELTVATNPVIRGRAVPVAATVTNHAARPQKTRVSFFLQQVKKHESEISLAAGESKRVTVALPFAEEGDVHLMAGIDPDALPLDNVRHRSVKVLTPQTVLVVRPTPPPGSNVGPEDVFVRHALNPLDRRDAPVFRTESRDPDELSRRHLDAARVVLLVNVPALPAPAVAALREYVLGGGNLVIWLGPLVDPTWYNRALIDESGSAPLLPARLIKRLGNAVARSASYRLTDLDVGHPAFRMFGADGNGDPGRARIYEFYQVEPSPAASVLARFSQGLPALVEERRGEGRIVLIPTTADTRWNDWPLRPTFLPFLHQLLLGMLSEQLLAHDDVTPSTPISMVVQARGLESAKVVPPGGEPVDLPFLGQSGGLTHLTIHQTAAPGMYRVRLRRGGADRSYGFTVNPPAREGNLRRLALGRIPRFRMFEDRPGQGATVAERVEAAQQGREIAMPLLWALLVLVVVESLFANLAWLGAPAR